jgi:hypothetical protein
VGAGVAHYRDEVIYLERFEPVIRALRSDL